jgi:acetyltransferase-like isoleucine patch superfamily enzyme
MSKKTLIRVLRKVINSIFQEEPKYILGNNRGHNTHVDSLTPQFVKIGDRFISGPNSMIISHDASYRIFSGYYRVEPVEIGDDVFLGAGAIVLPGVKIGNKVVIGAGSIVTKDVPDNCVVAGNPAKVICSLDKYLEKAKKKGVLYKAPIETDIFQRHVTSFQRFTVKEFHKRNPESQNWIKHQG